MDIVIVKNIFLKYILLPLIVIIMGGLLVSAKKRIPAIKTKILTCYIIIGGLCMGILGFFGFYGELFNPYLYLLCMLLFLSLGVLNVNMLHKYFKLSIIGNSSVFPIFFETLVTITTMIFGAYIFYLIFNWLCPYKGFSVMASTSVTIFIVPLAFYYCYLHFINIPFDIYKTWRYTPHQQPIDIDGIDYNKLMVLNYELSKTVEDGKRSNIKAKAPADGVNFGEWFFKVVSDYNHKNPNATIKLSNADNDPYLWVFYIKKSFFHFRRFIDFDQDITQNKIEENNIIICKRVSKDEYDDATKLI